LLELAFETNRSFTQTEANNIIKVIKKGTYDEVYFDILKDHPYFHFNAKTSEYDFQFDFLRDHLRSIKIYTVFKENLIVTKYLKFVAEQLRPYSVLSRLLIERNKNKNHILKYLISLVNERRKLAKNDQLNSAIFIDDAISNLFNICLQEIGNNKSSATYTKLMKKAFLLNDDIDSMVFKDCPHASGVIFNFKNLVFTNSIISNYTRFFECQFTESTFFWDDCTLSQIKQPEIPLGMISAIMDNFSPQIGGDKTYRVLIKKDDSESMLNSISRNSIRKLLSSMLHQTKYQTKAQIMKRYLSTKEYNNLLFDLTFNALLQEDILLEDKGRYGISKQQIIHASEYIENSFPSTRIFSALRLLKNDLQKKGIKNL